MYGGYSPDAQSDSSEGGYSHKRMCCGVCGALPAIAWFCGLVALLYFYKDATCSHTSTGEGDIMLFLRMSAGGFFVLFAIEVVEGCIAGEHDFQTSPQEIAINCCTGIVFIALYIVNYYGVIQIYTAEACTDDLVMIGWLVLVGNNLVWFATIATMVATGLCGTAIAAADFASGDRL